MRQHAPLTPEFIDSIRQHGVLSPVLAHQQDGVVTVRAGQRRTLAAREAGLATIPVYLIDADADSPAVERIVQQVIENDQRQALTDTDRVAAWQQLALAGLTPTVIARRTGAPRTQVSHGLTVAHSPAATEALTTGITLEHAAALIDFDDDADTRGDLTEIALTETDRFPHALQRARDERARTALRLATEADLTADGWTIISRDTAWWPSSDWIPAHRLTDHTGQQPDPAAPPRSRCGASSTPASPVTATATTSSRPDSPPAPPPPAAARPPAR